jgi:glycosyltransferase involved in cell wall biosynthesis
MNSRKGQQPIRVLHIIPGLPRGGAEGVLLRLTVSLRAEGIESSVVSLTTLGEMGPELHRHGVPVTALGIRGALDSVGGLARLFGVLRKEQPNVVQTWLYAGDLFGTLAALPSRRPIVWNVRSSDMKTHGRDRTTNLVPILAAVSRLPKAVVVNSGAGQHYHERRGYRPRRWVRIRNGFDCERFSPSEPARRQIRTELGFDDDTLVVGSVGRYNAIKNHEATLRVAEVLMKRHSNVRFVFAGSGLDDDNDVMTSLARTLHVKDSCTFLGDRNDIEAVYRAFDIFLSMSLSEGLPNCVAEAMASGVPCAVTNVGDTSDLVGGLGVLFPPHSVDAAVKACLTLAEMKPEKRRLLGLEARALIVQEFSPAAETAAYAALYREVGRPL